MLWEVAREMDKDVVSDVGSGAAMTTLFFYVLSGKIHPDSAILSSFWKSFIFIPWLLCYLESILKKTTKTLLQQHYYLCQK